MKRRDVISVGVSAAASLTVPGCLFPRDKSTPITYPSPRRLVVDAHCHLFNGSDLPSVRFLKIVVAKAYPRQAVKVLDIDDPTALDAVIAIFLWIVGSTRAPTGESELRVLRKIEVAERRNSEDSENERAVISALAEMIVRGDVSVSSDLDSASARRARSIIFAAAGENGLAVSTAQVDERDAQVLAERAYRSKFDLGILLRWFSLFTKYRYVLAETLYSDYRRDSYQPALLCPALIDYDYWLGQYVDATPLPQQVEVLGRLARRRTGPVIHGYVPFDPLRQVAYEAGVATEFDPLSLVKQALIEQGQLGVKLYPPMGFRPLGNTDACQTYPEPVLRLIAGSLGDDPTNYANCRPIPRDGSALLGHKLDRAMEALFNLCDKHKGCVIAHANNSNGSNVDYGKRADPGYWVNVFNRWPTLRVTLAHFGSFDSLSVSSPSKELPEGSWEWSFGNYIKLNPLSTVYADISFLTEVSGKSDQELDLYAAKVRRWIDTFDPDCRHLLFGSDWIMLGADPSYVGYATRVENFFRKKVGLSEDRLHRLFIGNALDFTGFSENSPARSRLEAFYIDNNLPMKRFPSA